MSIFLSAAENVAGQRLNVRRDLKNMEEESIAIELALENHYLFFFFFFFLFVLYRKMFQLQ